MNQNILLKARNEAGARRNKSVLELNKLTELLNQSDDVSSALEELPKLFANDLEIHQKLMEVLDDSKEKSFALKTNKLAELFKGALEVKDFNKSYISDVKTEFDNNSSDLFSTSQPNFYQTALLRLFGHLDVSFKNKLLEVGIYNPEESPLLQTVALPSDFDHSKMPELKDWFWYYSDAKSPVNGEILIPTMGYAFGGSRSDERYADKEFKNEDCSSAVGKWAEIDVVFSTWCMEEAWKYHFTPSTCDDQGNCQKEPPVGENLIGILDKLHPRAKDEHFEVGDVYLIRGNGGHTGVVSAVIDDQNFEGLSYNRNMPDFEGLGYNTVSMVADKNYYFFYETVA